MNFHDHVEALLSERARHDLLRHPRVISGPQGPEVLVDGRRAICLCSNNYLGLASHPAVAQAATEALNQLGYGACGSRQITGTMDLHLRAEARLAHFLETPRALLFATGYLANLAALQGVADRDTVIFSDALNHASLIDGCRLSHADTVVYPHADVAELERLLERNRARHGAALVVTESLFSMDGDIAPLAELRALCDRFDCGLIVDEAHAIGVLGPRGRGICARESIPADLIVGTLGKAFGTAGAFVAGSARLIELLENRARAYVFSTAPSPSLPAAALAATDLIESADGRRATLLAAAATLRAGLADLGYELGPGRDHVIPVLIGGAAETMSLSARLLELGVFVHGIRPPTVPRGTSRLRVTPMATHEPRHLDIALQAFARARASTRT